MLRWDYRAVLWWQSFMGGCAAAGCVAGLDRKGRAVLRRIARACGAAECSGQDFDALLRGQALGGKHYCVCTRTAPHDAACMLLSRVLLPAHSPLQIGLPLPIPSLTEQSCRPPATPSVAAHPSGRTAVGSTGDRVRTWERTRVARLVGRSAKRCLT
jgi:hypothetical protein